MRNENVFTWLYGNKKGENLESFKNLCSNLYICIYTIKYVLIKSIRIDEIKF